MQDGVYNVIETIEDLRMAEVTEFDMKLDGITNKVVAYRVKVRLSFKYHKH